MARRWIGLGLVALAAGCGSSGGGDGGPGDGGAAPDEGPPVVHSLEGFVRLGQGAGASSLFASMTSWSAVGTAPCIRVGEGACTLLRCDRTAEQGARSAGDLTASVGSGEPSLTLGPVDGAYPALPATGGVLWGENDEVVLTAAGADAPAFSTTLQPGLAEIVLTAPELRGVGPEEISRTEDLPVAWTGDATEEAFLIVAFTSENEAFTGRTQCLFPAEDGEGEVPLEVLTMVPGDLLEVTVGAGAVDQVRAGAWVVDVSAAVSVSDGVATAEGNLVLVD